ncbi:hypothetical protein SEPCBS57363_005668 [Sporothrix epigloea]|uniref:Uncharacterized protein n=1 Tax=Sporothrix epigloea TaxID=1892477 RepID=A0ABP0DZ35_9PEZI
MPKPEADKVRKAKKAKKATTGSSLQIPPWAANYDIWESLSEDDSDSDDESDSDDYDSDPEQIRAQMEAEIAATRTADRLDAFMENPSSFLNEAGPSAASGSSAVPVTVPVPTSSDTATTASGRMCTKCSLNRPITDFSSDHEGGRELTCYRHEKRSQAGGFFDWSTFCELIGRQDPKSLPVQFGPGQKLHRGATEMKLDKLVDAIREFSGYYFVRCHSYQKDAGTFTAYYICAQDNDPARRTDTSYDVSGAKDFACQSLLSFKVNLEEQVLVFAIKHKEHEPCPREGRERSLSDRRELSQSMPKEKYIAEGDEDPFVRAWHLRNDSNDGCQDSATNLNAAETAAELDDFMHKTQDDEDGGKPADMDDLDRQMEEAMSEINGVLASGNRELIEMMKASLGPVFNAMKDIDRIKKGESMPGGRKPHPLAALYWPPPPK